MKNIITIALILALSACGGSSSPDTNNSNIDNVIETLNENPVANAGVGQDVITFLPVVLNGSTSFDPQNDPLTYSWTLKSKPQGSLSTLFDTESITPSFTPDVDGVYTISLIVNDGVNDSLVDTVFIAAITPFTPPTNKSPVANAGINQDVITFLPVVLNGSTSFDPQNDPLTYSWTLKSKPQGSLSTLFDTESITPSFTPDVDGVYTISLIVNDGVNDSLVDTVFIAAITLVTPPPTNVFTGTVSLKERDRYELIGEDIYILTSFCSETTSFADVEIHGNTIEFVRSGRTCSVTDIIAKDNLSNGSYAVTVSRDTSNWYEVKFVGGYIETNICFEFVFFDNAILDIDFNGTGTLFFGNGDSCRVSGYYSPAEL